MRVSSSLGSYKSSRVHGEGGKKKEKTPESERKRGGGERGGEGREGETKGRRAGQEEMGKSIRRPWLEEVYPCGEVCHSSP